MTNAQLEKEIKQLKLDVALLKKLVNKSPGTYVYTKGPYTGDPMPPGTTTCGEYK